MILVAGGTGALGRRVVSRLTAQGLRVRILTRDRARARLLEGDRVEIVTGDVRDQDAVRRATEGAQTVVSAIQGFQGEGNVSPRTVDWEGNRNLIRTAQAAGVQKCVLVSMHGADPRSPMELLRMKYRAEQELRASRLAWTIIRPTVSMETWLQVLGDPLIDSGKTRVFGRGTNPINFVSVEDVARYVEMAVLDPAMQGTVLEVGGPENLTMRQFIETVMRVTGATGSVQSVPLPIMRVASALLGPVMPAVARLIQAGIIMDTTDMTFDPTETDRRTLSISPTSLADIVSRSYPDQAPVAGSDRTATPSRS